MQRLSKTFRKVIGLAKLQIIVIIFKIQILGWLLNLWNLFGSRKPSRILESHC